MPSRLACAHSSRSRKNGAVVRGGEDPAGPAGQVHLLQLAERPGRRCRAQDGFGDPAQLCARDLQGPERDLRASRAGRRLGAQAQRGIRRAICLGPHAREDRSSIWRGCANTSTASEARVPRQSRSRIRSSCPGQSTDTAHPLEEDVSAAVGAPPSGRCFRTRRPGRGQGGAVRIGADDRSRSTAGHRQDQLGAALPSRLRTRRLGADVAFHAPEQGQRQPLQRRHIRRVLRWTRFRNGAA